MKHVLQWKFIGIMFISIVGGVAAIATSQAVIYGRMQGMTAEEAELAAVSYAVWFDLLFVVVTILLFLLLSRRIIKRIEVMNHAVEQIAEGKLRETGTDQHWDELGSLSRNISRMAEKIADSLEKERSMVCSVAHDLRTPVTSIQGYARLLEKSPELLQENKDYVSIIQKKSISLAEQIEELLEYSVLQFEEKEYAMEPLSLRCLIEQVLIEMIPMLEQRGMTFSMEGSQSELQLPCNQLLMIRLFENLFTNCVRYGKSDSIIQIQLNETDEKIEISISNDGSTLTKEETAHLFEAFYQGKDAREYRTGCQGLGLAIAQKIVLLHRGSIQAQSDEKTQRITFSISFVRKL